MNYSRVRVLVRIEHSGRAVMSSENSLHAIHLVLKTSHEGLNTPTYVLLRSQLLLRILRFH